MEATRAASAQGEPFEASPAYALASVLNLLLLSLIGFGLGSLFAGVLNDQLRAVFGEQAIRYSLAVVALMSLWSGAHNLLSARTLLADLAAREQRA